jgi:hypothetical protein
MTSGTMPIYIRTAAAPSAAITVKSEKFDFRKTVPEFRSISANQDRLSGNYSFEFRQAGSVFPCQPVGKK